MSESDLGDLEREITSLLDRLDRLYEEVVTAIDANPDPDQAFKRATQFANLAQGAHNEVASRLARLRARQANRIRESRSLSLSGLATRLSISKARADQLVRDATREGT